MLKKTAVTHLKLLSQHFSGGTEPNSLHGKLIDLYSQDHIIAKALPSLCLGPHATDIATMPEQRRKIIISVAMKQLNASVRCNDCCDNSAPHTHTHTHTHKHTRSLCIVTNFVWEFHSKHSILKNLRKWLSILKFFRTDWGYAILRSRNIQVELRLLGARNYRR
jgi:hypothetical protein